MDELKEPLASSAKPRLRVGLLIDSLIQPRWVHQIIKELKSSSIVELTVAVKNKTPAKVGRVHKFWQQRSYLLYHTYTRLDDFMFETNPDAFERIDIEDLIEGVPVIDVVPVQGKYTDAIGQEDVERILSYDLDVALRFGFRILKGEFLKIARYGVWSYHHGDGLLNRGMPPGFWEVMKNERVTGSMLQVLTEELDNGRIIYRSWGPTINRFSVKKANNNSYWKASAFVMRKLKDLYEFGPHSLADTHSNSDYRPYSNRLYKKPTNSEMLPLILKLTGRSIARLFDKLFFMDQWILAYRVTSRVNDPNNTLYKYKYLIPEKDRFWADPFPLKVNGKFYIFFEEFIFKKEKAHICVVEVDAHGIVSGPFKVLERPYHLSYPFVFEWNGDYYMIPESGGNNTVELYRCREFPLVWEMEKVLIHANNPLDATLAEIDGKWWMFVNIEVAGVSVNWDELHLYYSDSPLGPWKPHQKNPVKSDVRSSRPAGKLFQWNGQLLRPAQDCSNGYGYATSINRVVRISPCDYLEEEVSRIEPDWEKHITGTHTLNLLDDITVVDCRRKTSKPVSG
jgi:hypothetical protein